MYISRGTTTEKLVREYITAINLYPVLTSGEETDIINQWKQGDYEALDKLLCCNLRYVIYWARRIAWSHYKSHNYWPALRELIGAGNYGLLMGAERFRHDEGILFRTAADDSIRKEITRQALFDRSVVSRPYDVKFDADIKLDGVRKADDREIDIPDRPDIRQNRLSAMLAAGLAKLLADDTDQRRDLQIWFDIHRLRYERPALPIKLKIIAANNGVSEPRVSQLNFKAGQKIHAAVMSNAGERRITPFPKWHNIVEWCDLPKKRRDDSGGYWRGASDFNIQRVEAAVDRWTEIPELQFTTPDGYNPAEHFTKIIEFRRKAAEQDREQRERVERYLESKALEQRVTLTTKGYRAATELNRNAENGASASAREHTSFAKRAGPAA